MLRLVLIDGNAILHRAYHALPPMINSKGQQTNAVYGFISMFFRVISDLQPTHVAVTFDREKPTFRKKLFKEYQSQRPKMEDQLASQVGLVHEVLEAMKIPIYEHDGFEADDVLGSIALQVQNSKFHSTSLQHGSGQALTTDKVQKGEKIEEVVIVTGDRDLLQLVDKHIKLYMPHKGLSESKIYGEKEAGERMGVPPKQIPDLKALMGDPSDNYSGVSGIGPKTAATLLKEFGSIENLYKHLNSVKNNSLVEKLVKDKNNALLSHKLATIITDVPITFDYQKAQLHDLATDEAIKIFGKLEFKTLLKRLLNLNKVATNTKVKETTSVQVNQTKNQLGLF